jgi:thymidylate synthase
MPFKTIVTELLWFLRGDTNIKYLVDNNCHIWDGDAYKRFYNETQKGLDSMFLKNEGPNKIVPFTQEEFINKIKTDDEFAKQWGELGPIYGKQWRNWGRFEYEGFTQEGSETSNNIDVNWKKPIDQIQNLINDLKTNPDSRRLMVNAWNVGELDQMTLPPCHYGFQVYTRELSLEERIKLFSENVNGEHLMKYADSDGLDVWNEILNKHNIPTRAISLMFNMRSVDTFLGLPFNIASYGLLLKIIAKEVNMVPDELIGNLGDTHLYLNHLEQAKEQIGRELTLEERIERMYQINEKDSEHLFTQTDPSHHLFDNLNVPKRTREPFELPTLKINGTEPSIIEKPKYWKPDDFTLLNYQSHPTIKAPLSN